MLVLVIRTLAGNYIVDNVVVTESVRPAASEAWRILTDSLAASAWAAVWVGVLTAVGAWLTGEGGRATSSRRWLAPHLRRPEVAYGVFAVLLLVALWLLPVQEFRNTVILLVLSVVGFEVLRRQVAREAPAAGGGRGGRGRERLAGCATRAPSILPHGRTRAAREAARGRALTDEEYAAAKAACCSSARRSGGAEAALAARELYDAMSKKTPSATSSQPAPLTPSIGPHASTYMIDVQGRKIRPSSGQTQPSNAASTLSPKIHHAASAMRGPKPPSRIRKQHTARPI